MTFLEALTRALGSYSDPLLTTETPEGSPPEDAFQLRVPVVDQKMGNGGEVEMAAMRFATDLHLLAYNGDTELRPKAGQPAPDPSDAYARLYMAVDGLLKSATPMTLPSDAEGRIQASTLQTAEAALAALAGGDLVWLSNPATADDAREGEESDEEWVAPDWAPGLTEARMFEMSVAIPDDDLQTGAEVRTVMVAPRDSLVVQVWEPELEETPDDSRTAYDLLVPVRFEIGQAILLVGVAPPRADHWGGAFNTPITDEEAALTQEVVEGLARSGEDLLASGGESIEPPVAES